VRKAEIVADRWEVLAEEVLLDASPWIKVIAETIRLEDGETVIDNFYRVDSPTYAIIFALTAERQVVLVKQYRHAFRRRVLELPAGVRAPGEKNLLETARRELREETGYESPEWYPIGRFAMDANRGCGWTYAFLALDAIRVSAPSPVDLQTQSVHLYSLEQLRDFWLTGDCSCAPVSAVIGLGLALVESGTYARRARLFADRTSDSG
jgi:ADP-ribose pyrophosphatase